MGRLTPWVLVFFGLPFIAAGAGVLAYALRCWSTYAAARDWPEVPAVIEAVELKEHEGEETLTYSVAATYRYEFNGKRHTGHRVDIARGSSGNYVRHSKRYDELEAHRAQGLAFRAFVNPDDPSEAVLYRDADAWMYAFVPFGIVFVGAGACVMTIGVVALARRRRLAQIAREPEGRLWHMRGDWCQGQVKASERTDLLLVWLLGVGASVFVSIFVILVVGEGAPGWVWAVLGLFVLFALFVLLWAVLLTVHVLARGSPVLHFLELPIVPGRQVPALVHIAGPLKADRWRIRLQCLVPSTNVSSKRHNERMHALLEQLKGLPGVAPTSMRVSVHGYRAYYRDVRLTREPEVSRTGRPLLPIALEVPAGAPETSLDPGFAITWVLNVKAGRRPWSFSANFMLPVFSAPEDEIRTMPTSSV